MGEQVSSFFGLLGLKVDKSAWAQGHQQINTLRTALLGLGAYVTGNMLGKAFLGFSSSAEQGILQLKMMLALARHTDLADQAKDADKMYASLQKRAAALPGTLEEYIGMAGKITRVGIEAGLSIQELEDMTVNAVVAAKGLGEQWEVSARDIEQAIMGRFNTTDPFSSKVLGSAGYKGEEGRAKFKALNEKQRAKEYLRALNQKQFTQGGDEAGKTLEGRMDQFKDSIKQTLGTVGKPLFEMFKGLLENVSKWIDKNQQQITEFAKAVGGGLKEAFQSLGAAVVSTYEFLTGGSEKAKLALTLLAVIGVNMLLPMILRIGAAIKFAFGPWGLIIVGITLLLNELAKALGFDNALEMLKAGFESIKGPATAVLSGIAVAVRDVADAYYEVIEAIEVYAAKLAGLARGEDVERVLLQQAEDRKRLRQWDREHPEEAKKAAEIKKRQDFSQGENTDGRVGPTHKQVNADEARRQADFAKLYPGAPSIPSVPVPAGTNSTIGSHNTTTVSVVVHEATNAKDTADKVVKKIVQDLADRHGIQR